MYVKGLADKRETKSLVYQATVLEKSWSL